MKRLLLLTFLACCSSVHAEDVQGKVLNYGLFKPSGEEKIVKSPETPSGFTRIPPGTSILITSTNRIPAKMGVRFGMWYEITNVTAPDGEIEVTKIARHPTIKKPDGTTSTGFTFVEKQSVKAGRIVAWTGYGFDHPYELVAGDWEFEMQFKGKTVCKQKFTIVKE